MSEAVRPATAGESSDPEFARRALRIVFLTVFLDMAGFSIIFPLYPRMLAYYLEREGTEGLVGAMVRGLDQLSVLLGGSPATSHVILFGGALGSIYAILQFFCAPLFGQVSDRYGRKPVLLIGIGGLAISYLLWVFAGSFLVLILARVLGGLMSGNISTASAVIADVTPHQRRSRGMALIGVGIGTAFMFGPAVGGFGARFDLTAHWPWLEAYGINRYSVPALAAFTLTMINWFSIAIRLRETLPPGKAPSAITWRALNLAALFRTEKYPGVTRANMTYFLFLIAFSGMEFSLTFLATERLNYDEHDIPSMFIFIGVVLILMQGTYVRLMSGAIGPKRMSTHGLMLGIPGLVIGGSAHHTATLFLGLFVMAVASSQVRPCMSALVSLYTPISDQGRVLGVFRSLESLARALGPLLACALYWRLGSSMAYYIAAAVMLAPLLLIRALPAVGTAPVESGA